MSITPGDTTFRNARHSAPATPKPRKILWSLQKDGKRPVRCELLFHEDAIEVQLFVDSGFIMGQRCANRAGAELVAGEIRDRYLATGWTIG